MNVPYEKMPVYENPLSTDAGNDGLIHVQQAPPNIRHYFVFSLFSAICLCPATGLVALAYSLKSSAKADVKFHDKAQLYSRRALLWNIISVIFAVLVVVMVLVFCYCVNEMVKSDRNRMYSNFYAPSNGYNNEIN
ncbi:unnamed protein product [Adineta steineri]|uniref:Uncharacterized protein n=1 Tax=Adineta steineri TaxID=433720 RepID=A0A814EVF2_9BILA|nr:unnamed protein product [Adineta steineri]CAF1258890.1 unnamed protein product [Adineta steineri]CAF1400488.1 unnamed protein product [Adineta steineri]